ncbi:TIGR03943 family putative permease subunit [Butyrivibrio sp. ob235]|uniref:TIGR03943 family putative permease subunit n=1 Tax=Butyrivibrio sp. ob235 TaxID=1761780 RepID=UPI003FA44933
MQSIFQRSEIQIDDREWVEISGILRIRFDDEMQRNIPVCRVTDIKEIDKPDKEIISLI